MITFTQRLTEDLGTFQGEVSLNGHKIPATVNTYYYPDSNQLCAQMRLKGPLKSLVRAVETIPRADINDVILGELMNECSDKMERELKQAFEYFSQFIKSNKGD